MLLKVNPHKIEIVKSPVNEREINISKCTFEFADEITNDYVKEAYFTFGGTTYKQIIVNDECDFPSEVLTKKGTVEIGVVAYLVENETEIKRYNPSPAYFDTWAGSLKDKAENSEPITPSEMEQFEQALNDGLNEVNDKLDEIDQAIDDVNEAIIETNNLDLDVDKQGKVATVTLTKKDASTKTVTLSDGTSLMFNWDGTKLGIKTDNEQSYTYVDLEGPQGPQGVQGEAFTIKKTYSSIAEMNADFNNMQVGDYVMIANSVETEDNAKLYTRGEEAWIFITDFSGATGIQGEQGPQGIQGPQGPQGIPGPQGETGTTGNGILSIQKTSTVGLVDTYTITFTDGTTTTFDITNGEDGEVTQTQLDETNNNVSWLQTLAEQMPHVSGQGTDLSLENVLNYRLMKFLPQGSSSQESTTGKNLFNKNNYSVLDNANVSSSATINIENNFALIYISLPAGTYTISNDIGSYQWLISDCNEIPAIGVSTSPRQVVTGTSATYTMNSIGYLLIRVAKNSFSISDFVNKLQIEQGATATSYEPYTGGIPAPNPSYQIMPSRVTGENSLIISSGNLFDKNSGLITNNKRISTSTGGSYSSNGYSISPFIEVKPDTQYNLTSGIQSYYCWFDEKEQKISGSTWNTGESKTSPSNVKYVKFDFQTSNIDTIMFTKGSTAPTTYVEHEEQNYQLSLGNIELNSSPDGTIRDYIYGTPDNWYKREYIGKVVLDGSENWDNLNMGANYKRTNVSLPSNPKNIGTRIICLSNYFKYGNSYNTDIIGSCFISNLDNRLYLYPIQQDNLASFKTWLQEKYETGNPVIVWYSLAQYTDIPITDTTLITQLNNIYNNAHSYNGVTNITTTYEDGNEQMYLDIEALKNVWDTSL